LIAVGQDVGVEMDFITELLLRTAPQSSCWEHEERASYSLDEMREEFKERMCSNMNKEYPEFIWTFKHDRYDIYKLQFIKEIDNNMLKYNALCDDFDDDEKETLVRTYEIIYKGEEMYECADYAYWAHYPDLVQFINDRIDRVIEFKKKEIKELEGKKVYE